MIWEFCSIWYLKLKVFFLMGHWNPLNSAEDLTCDHTLFILFSTPEKLVKDITDHTLLCICGCFFHYQPCELTIQVSGHPLKHNTLMTSWQTTFLHLGPLPSSIPITPIQLCNKFPPNHLQPNTRTDVSDVHNCSPHHCTFTERLQAKINCWQLIKLYWQWITLCKVKCVFPSENYHNAPNVLFTAAVGSYLPKTKRQINNVSACVSDRLENGTFRS